MWCNPHTAFILKRQKDCMSCYYGSAYRQKGTLGMKNTTLETENLALGICNLVILQDPIFCESLSVGAYHTGRKMNPDYIHNSNDPTVSFSIA